MLHTIIEWFKNLSEGWQIAIFGVGVTFIGGIFTLLKWLFSKKTGSPAKQKTIQQKGKRHTSIITNGNKGNVAGGDIHTGVDTEVLNAAMKALNKVLEMVDTDQSNKLTSELKKLSDEKINTPTELIYNKEQKIRLEKEFQLYGELWKALLDVRSSIIITPTVDRWPEGKSPYDVYQNRCDAAIDAFNKAKNLFENNRPFYHDDVSKITKEFLSRCRGYIFKVQRALRSENFDEKLHDEADELHEIITKAIDEIEKAIKVRIGLLPMSEVDKGVSIGPGLGSIVEISKGSITYKSNTLNIKQLIGFKTSVIGGYVKLNDFGKLEANIRTDVPFEALQRLNEQLGLDSMCLLSESDTISLDSDNPTVFTSSTSHILPQGAMLLDFSTGQEVSISKSIHVKTQTTASGHLKGKVFQGKFEAILIYHENNLRLGLNGDFQVHLA